MNVLTSYIVKEILKGSAIALVILLTLFNLFTFADEIKDIGKENYNLKQIVYYVTFTSPSIIYELVPASALIGSLFVLGAMGNNRELIAMKSAGLSTRGIIKSTLIAGVFMVVFSTLIGEFIAPTTERLAQKIRNEALNKQLVANLKYGIWFREGSNFINVREVRENGKLANVYIYEVNEQRHLQNTIHADKATFIKKNTWKLENIKESNISTGQITTRQQAETIWESTIAPDLLKIAVVDSKDLSLYDLAMYIKFLKTNHQKSHAYEAAFWGRAFIPVTTFVMLLVSAPFVIGIHRGVSVGARILMGVTIGMGFNIFDKIINHFGLIYDLNPLFMAILPNLLVLTMVYTAMRKVST